MRSSTCSSPRGSEFRLASSGCLHLTNVSSSAAEVSQTIVTMLPGSANVNAVYGDLAEQFKALPPEMVQSTLCIDSTTHSVEVAKTVSQQIHATGAAIVDAPVSGGVYMRFITHRPCTTAPSAPTSLSLIFTTHSHFTIRLCSSSPQP